jgi:hypothetical protein
LGGGCPKGSVVIVLTLDRQPLQALPARRICFQSPPSAPSSERSWCGSLSGNQPAKLHISRTMIGPATTSVTKPQQMMDIRIFTFVILYVNAHLQPRMCQRGYIWDLGDWGMVGLILKVCGGTCGGKAMLAQDLPT